MSPVDAVYAEYARHADATSSHDPRVNANANDDAPESSHARNGQHDAYDARNEPTHECSRHAAQCHVRLSQVTPACREESN